MTEYPEEWLCTQCNRPFKLHLKIGNFDKRNTRNSKNWCFEIEGYDEKNGWSFDPVDNLTLIEKIAEEKKLI
jgi:hypothetical protein